MKYNLSAAAKILLCTLLCLMLSGQSLLRADEIPPPDSIIPPALFGMHIHRAASTTPWPSVSFKTWRLWDANVAWPWLEPKKGEWDFRNLDKMVDLASSHGVEVLLPMGLSPGWASARPDEPSIYGRPGFAAEPKNIADWENYVRTVAARYKGRIHCYEIWNEPNLKGFYSGSVSQMIDLTREAYKILKKIDPSVIVVSPSATSDNGPGWLDEYLAGGGGKYVDVIGYHFYVAPGPPEAMVPLITKVKAVMQKHNIGIPLWNTETGWLIANTQSVVKPEGPGFKSKVLSNDEAEAYIARSYILNWAMGVERLYWYAWDNGIMGFTEPDGRTVKPFARAYSVIQKWLVGARMTSCASDSDGVWTCALIRDGGYAAWIMWRPDKTVRMRVPEDWGVRYVKDLKGNRRAIDRAAKVEIGPSPVLLEKPAK